jgi:hypothetical protein
MGLADRNHSPALAVDDRLVRLASQNDAAEPIRRVLALALAAAFSSASDSRPAIGAVVARSRRRDGAELRLSPPPTPFRRGGPARRRTRDFGLSSK